MALSPTSSRGSSGGGAPTGNAGGSLGGTYPNPTFAAPGGWGVPTQTGAAVIAASIPLWICTSAALTAATQQVFLQAVYIETGRTITSISFLSNSTALSGGNHQYFGLYDSGGNLLRATADATNGSWNANSLKTRNLSSQYVTTTSGLYYLAILIDATTPPTLTGTTTAMASAATGAMGSGSYACGAADAGVTSLPNPTTTFSTQGKMIYCHCS